MELHELHPSLVHLPIALLPASLAADAAGARYDGLAEAGRLGIAVTVGSAVLAAASGFVAQEEVHAGEAHDLLTTHRTLNIAALGLTAAMAAYRVDRERAGPGYLAAGLAAVGLTLYAAYLGGRMVYAHGVGVKPAGGLRPDHAPPLGKAPLGTLLRRAGRELRHGVRHAFDHFRQGDVAPALTPDTDETA